MSDDFEDRPVPAEPVLKACPVRGPCKWEARAQRYRHALAWYAEAKNWPIGIDRGQRAREALAESEAEGGE